MEYEFAELNVARLHWPIDAAENAEFTSALLAINLLAETSDGFIWRLQDDSGQSASYVRAYDDPHMIINVGVWRDAESLKHYVYRSGHGAYFRRRSEWFEKATEISMVCWWVEAGVRPTLDDAMARLEHLRTHGPSERGFAFENPLPKPSS